MATLDRRSLLAATSDGAFRQRDTLLREEFTREYKSIERIFWLLATELVLDQRREQLQASAAGRAQEHHELRQRISARRLIAWAEAHPALSLN